MFYPFLAAVIKTPHGLIRPQKINLSPAMIDATVAR